MGIVKEQNFPRGGRKPSKLQTTDKKSRSAFKLFGGKQKIKKKKSDKKQSNKKKINEKKSLKPSEPLSLISAELLTYNKIQEGMVILGCIREVNRMDIVVSLPGRLSAKIQITNISLPYTNLLKFIVEQNNPSEDYHGIAKLFHVGQYVRCKVISVSHSVDNELHKVIASLSPHDIQADWKHSQLEQNLVITAAVSSVEDHGYVMDVGIKETRAFLPKENTSEELGVGQVLWCNIAKVTKTEVAATVILSTNFEQIFKNTVVGGSLNDLLPGMKVNFKIEKIVAGGLEGKFLSNFVGYISETHLSKPLQDKSSYHVGDTVEACILYIVPTTKITFLTLKDISHKPVMELPEGHIVSNAKVVSRVGKGLYLKLSKKDKGFISYRRLKQYKPGAEIEEVLNAYPIGSTHRCRVIDFDYIESVYICTMEKDLVSEKYFSVNDFQVGEVVPVIVEKIHSAGIEVKAGRVQCFVKNLHLTDIPLQSSTDIGKKFKIGQKLNARVLHVNTDLKSVLLTLKPTLVESKLPCLTAFDNYDKKKEYEGVVVQISPNGLLVCFYGDVRGWVPVREITLNANEKIADVFYIGQIVKCRVLFSNPNEQKMTLSLKPYQKSNKTIPIKIGDKISATVTKVTSKGLEMKVEKFDGVAVLPTLHLSEHPKLAPLLLEKYQERTREENLLCIGVTSENIYLSKRESQFIEEIPVFEKLEENTLLRCAFRNTFEKGMLLFSPIENFKRYVLIPNKFVSDEPIKDLDDLKLEKYQPIVAKVMKIDKENQAIIATTKLSECWDKSINFGVNYLSTYLCEIDSIREFLSESDNALSKIELGGHVKGKVKSVTDTGDCVIKLANGIEALIPKELCTEDSQAKKMEGVVLWIDFPENKAIVSAIPRHKDLIANEQGVSVPQLFVGITVKCEIILVRPDFVLAVMFDKGQNQFLFLPVKVHYNDFEPDMSIYEVGAVCFATVTKIVNYKWYIGVLKNKKLKKQEMLEVTEETKENEVAEEVKSGKDQPESNKEEDTHKRGKKRTKPQKQNEKKLKNDNIETENEVLLPGVENFWSLTPDAINTNNESTEESEEEEKEVVESKKKKKLSKAEKRQQAQEEEMRIREKEMLFADENAVPTSAEQFDRLVLSKPDSSHAWISYMAFHLQSAEIEKARSVARKALSTISFREEQEKLNVWVALLNLENRYGTKESFSSVLEEAVRMNDSRSVHMSALKILADSNKQTEFTELLNTVLRKHKHVPDTWNQAATACFQLGMQEKARHLLQRALTCLDKKEHVNLIIKFAYLELKHGSQERAETLFEQVLASYPRRVDIWSSYVDMLVKSSRIDVARRVLERATSLKLPARKMKTLFKKFVDFEKVHGDEEAVEKVRQMAVKFVENATF